MKTIKLVHECNHIESIFTYEPVTEKIIKTLSTSNLLSYKTSYVIAVFQKDPLTRSGYKFFRENGSWRFNVNTNSIDWGINPGFEIPTVGEEVQVEYVKEIFAYKQMQPWECEKCNGNGWYVDYIGPSGSVEEISGSAKLTQDFIKELLTVKQENGYGTFISDLIGSNVYDDGEEIKEKIEAMLFQVRENMVLRQNEFVQNGIALSNSEKVSDIILQEIQHFDSYTKLVLTVYIQDMNGKMTQNALLIE